jgi:6-phosphogluconolactonase
LGGGVTIYIGSHDAGVSVRDAGLRPAAPSLPLPAPSYLVTHPALPAMYAVNELDDGGVTSLAADPDGSLSVTSRQPSGGAAPCHLTVTADGRHLLCANYGTGSVTVFPIRSDGTLDARTALVKHPGPEPHAHHVSVDGTDVTAVDLGNDTIYGYRLDDAGGLTPTWETHVGAGTGPRHLVTGPDGRRYGADEVGSTVSVYVADEAGRPELVHRRPATLTEPAGANHPSEIALSADSRFLYVANRGNDTIATFAIAPNRLVPVAETSTGGAWPRHFALVGDLMYVANQRSDRVTVLRLDPDTGVPEPTGTGIDIPSPACVLIVTLTPSI